MNTNKKHPAKILLFGEHVVLKGSDALAIPFSKFSGKWVHTPYPEMAETRQMDLPKFLEYLKEKSGSLDFFDIDTDAFAKELANGMYFQSNIPLGYGAGSSGSLCAAVYDSFALAKTSNPIHLKNIFSLMESFFHGSSSGFDPLVSFLNQPVKISEEETIPLRNRKPMGGLFLIDTGIKRSASKFIQIFLEKCKNEDYESQIENELVPLTTKAIAAYLKDDITSLFHFMHDISRFQYLYFNEFIPRKMVPFWEKGLRTNNFKMKLCGAGGGGFMLGVTKDFRKMEGVFGDFELVKI